MDITEFNYDDPNDPLTATVTVNIDGDEPSTVTAFFLRAINATQGSREEPMIFTKDPVTGNWIATYKFPAPGNYVLRTVRLDGVDYDLHTTPKITVTGFTVESLVCQQASEGNTINVMTAASSSKFDLSLKFASSDAAKMPVTVQGRFLRNEDGSAVNIDFVYDSTDNTCKGSRTCLTSGDYTLQYLLLNGEYTELPTGLWQTAHVVLGMRVQIYTTSPHSPNSFKYIPTEMADNEKLLGMQVKILDNAGNEMTGLKGVKLTYGMSGSGIKKMDTNLTWDGNYYVGELTTIGPGIWQFSQVEVAGNILTTAITSPTFIIQSPDPAAYYDFNTPATQIKMTPMTDPATMNVQISNSMALENVYAKIVKSDGTETWVKGARGGEFFTENNVSVNNWSFIIPQDANGYQDGNWQLVEIKITDALKEDGSSYSEEDPLIFDVSGTNTVTKVICRVYPTFTAGQSKDYGKTGDDVTAQFMTSHTFNGLSVDIKDFAGNPIPGITDVKLTFTYQNGSSGTYGKYTSTDLTNATEGATVSVALDTVSGTRYSQSADATILYAGEYITTLSFNVDGKVFTYTGSQDNAANNTKALPANAPKFTVSSKAPVVTVTGTNPAPGTTYRVYTVNQPKDTTMMVEGDFFKYTDYTAAVYIYTPNNGGGYDQEASHTYAPSVSLKLSGMPSTGFTSATMNFTTSNANSVGSTFTFGSNFTASAAIGKAVDGRESLIGVSTWPESYPAGKMVQNKLTVAFNGMTYEITLANSITIDQPQAPTVMMFTGIPGTYTGERPAQVVGNGNTVTVKLPEISWTAYTEEASDNATWSAYEAIGTND